MKPLLDVKEYKPTRPMRKAEVWSGSEGDLFAARVPEWFSLPQANYAVSRALTEELLADVKSYEKVLVKPDSSVSPGYFLANPTFRRIARENGVSSHADMQALTTPPSALAGVVDALLNAGAEEVHIMIDSPWLNPLRVAFETGFAEVFARPEYEGKVYFVSPYEGRNELEWVPLKWANGFDVGFFTHINPPRALFQERYKLAIIVSPVKTHSLTVYSLLLKNFGSLWRPPRSRWHALGFPVKLFESEYAGKILNIDVQEHKVFQVLSLGDRIVLSNGFSSSAPLPTCVEEGELLAVCDPHTGSTSMVPLLLSMGYTVIRYLGAYASLLDELWRAGTRVAGLVTGIVGMEGEGPLIYGKRRVDCFALAGASPLAVEVLALDVAAGVGRRGFEGAVMRVNRSFCSRYITDEELEEDIMLEAADPWTFRLAEELVREERDPSRYTLQLLDFGEGDKVNQPWDLRLGPPYKLPKHVYVSPRVLMRAVYTEDALFKRAFSTMDKGVTVPLTDMLAA